MGLEKCRIILAFGVKRINFFPVPEVKKIEYCGVKNYNIISIIIFHE